MFRLLGRLKGVLLLADCLIGPGGYKFGGGTKFFFGGGLARATDGGWIVHLHCAWAQVCRTGVPLCAGDGAAPLRQSGGHPREPCRTQHRVDRHPPPDAAAGPAGGPPGHAGAEGCRKYTVHGMAGVHSTHSRRITCRGPGTEGGAGTWKGGMPEGQWGRSAAPAPPAPRWWSLLHSQRPPMMHTAARRVETKSFGLCTMNPTEAGIPTLQNRTK